MVDKGKIMAEGSPASLIREYSTREVLELRFGSERNATVGAELEGIGERLETLPDRVLIYAHDGEAALEQVSARDPAWSPRWCAGHPWRTSSCA